MDRRTTEGISEVYRRRQPADSLQAACRILKKLYNPGLLLNELYRVGGSGSRLSPISLNPGCPPHACLNAFTPVILPSKKILRIVQSHKSWFRQLAETLARYYFYLFQQEYRDKFIWIFQYDAFILQSLTPPDHEETIGRIP